MTREQLICWVAGLFEGEGTISINSHGVRASIEMTDIDVLENVKSNFGGSLIEQKRRKGKEHYKISWRWQLTNSKEACEFLEVILPFLYSRRSVRVNEALKWYKESIRAKEIKAAKRQILLEEIKKLGETNISHKEIAIKLNVSRSYVSYTLQGKYK
jgi:hypothetical protein